VRYINFLFIVSAVTLLFTSATWAQTVKLAEAGKARAVIVVSPDFMQWEGDDKPLSQWLFHREMPEWRRRLQRDSVRDLAHYLGKMAGSKIDIVEQHANDDTRLPIYIGAAAEKKFGAIGKSQNERFTFRVVASSTGIGLYGKTEYGTSYAIYELLHRLGCRWYIPSEMGEVIPAVDAVSLPAMDLTLAPATLQRRMEPRTADADFRRRNRMNGERVAAQHALEGYITKEELAAHPEWRLIVNGKPTGRHLFKWTRQDVADFIAEKIIAKLDVEYKPFVSLSPGDYVRPTDDPEEAKADPDPRVWEPAANQWSVTDRLILLANRIAERVGKKHPNVKFGLLAYVNYSMPPARYKVHPNVVPQLAPIDFNRHHPMTWPNHPNKTWLIDLVKGWGKAAPQAAYYAYGMNLAEITAPNPFITKWGANLPIILKNGFTHWTPETMGGWESMMPAFYMSTRITFYPQEKPEDVVAELMQRFYGDAAEPMSAYWRHMDRCWIETEEYAGSAYGYLKMFPPAKLEQARMYIDDALARCQTVEHYQRVKLIDESLSLFELFMQMREDWASGNWRRLYRIADKLNNWRGSVRHLRRVYKKQYCFDSGLALTYVNYQFGAPYEDAADLVRTHRVLGKPMLKWKYQYDESKQAEAAGWTAPDFDDTTWPITHVVRDTWSSLDHHNTMGRMAYRTTVSLNSLPNGKSGILWIGSTDGSAKLFINGKHVPYVVPAKTRNYKAGDVIEEFSGYCKPARFDVTDHLQKGANQVTILCERTWLNELGTGGLMGPVLIVSEK